MAGGDNTTLQEVGRLDSLSTTYRTNAGRCLEIGNYLKSQATTMFWKSRAASNFEQKMEEYKKTLSDLQTQLGGLSEEVKRRATVLRESENV